MLIKSMRIFIAIDVNKEIREGCKWIIEKLNESGADLKTVKPENLHITLKFLGEVHENLVKEISESLKDFSEKCKSFRIGFSVLGYFGGVRFPRTIWIGITDGRGTISTMSLELNKMLSHIKNENKKPRPHLTLARVKSVKNSNRLVEVINENRDVNLGEIDVKEIKLMSSVLKPEGPVYSVLESFKLRKEMIK
jgi:2'-5' RNA ligase